MNNNPQNNPNEVINSTADANTVQPQVETQPAPVANTNQEQPTVQPAPDMNMVQQPVGTVPQGQPMQQVNNVVYPNQPGYNNVQSNSEAESGKVMGILSYIGFLSLIPFFAEKKNNFVIYHAKQGINLLLIELAVSVLINVIWWILPWEFYTFVRVISAVAGLAAIAISVLGIVNVCNAKMVELPVIGKIKIIK